MVRACVGVVGIWLLLQTVGATRAHAADIFVTTLTQGHDALAISIEPNCGCTGLYDPSSLTIADLTNPSKNPDGLVTLEEAIIAANNTPGADTIHLLPLVYSLSTVENIWYGPTALPPITSDITIEGHGATIERNGAAQKMRLFMVQGDLHPGGTGKVKVDRGSLTLRDLTLQGGFAQGGSTPNATKVTGGGALGAGGALFVQGSLTLDRCTLSDNTARGGKAGTKGTALANPQSVGGGMGADGKSDESGGFGTRNGYQFPGALFGGNGGLAGGGFSPGDDAVGFNPGSGGGAGSALCTPGGGGPIGRGNTPGCGPGPGGGSAGSSSGGFGGGGGTLVESAGDNGGFGGGGSGGWPGEHGGGIGGYGAGNGSSGMFGSGGGGGAGMGGAIFVHLGTVVIRNSTLSSNRALGGDSGSGSAGGGYGGAIFNLNGSVTIVSSTMIGNRVMVGAGFNDVSPASSGGAVYSLAINGPGIQNPLGTAALAVTNSVLYGSTDDATPTPASVTDVALDELTGNTTTATFDTMSIVGAVTIRGGVAASGTARTVDPQLGPLADNGGPTHSHAPLSGSPAIDTGDDAAASSLATDQRGYPRAMGAHVDVGAVESCGLGGGPACPTPPDLAVVFDLAASADLMSVDLLSVDLLSVDLTTVDLQDSPPDLAAPTEDLLASSDDLSAATDDQGATSDDLPVPTNDLGATTTDLAVVDTGGAGDAASDLSTVKPGTPKSGCACNTTSTVDPSSALLTLVVLALLRRRRAVVGEGRG